MGRDRERNEALRKLLTQLDEEYGPLPENDVERLMRDVYVSETSERHLRPLNDLDGPASASP
jgi:hypothetical protein